MAEVLDFDLEVSKFNFKLQYDVHFRTITLGKSSESPYRSIYRLNTGWNDKIVVLEKTSWFHFCLMKTGFLFLLQTIY